ncbi:hypothetical protein P261_01822 [Lachnospiraceae bacterium TWA4]|nr:hypothetical protein P261_01822 [Lachnospiraceae bacterium TWA4]
MSEFSEECSKIFKQNGITIYQFADKIGVDRTTLQRMNSGRKLPSRQFVKKVLDHLPISVNEREHLEHLFYIEKVGKQVYRRRQAVKELIENFYEVSKSMTEANYHRKLNFSIEQFSDEKSVNSISMEVDIIDALRYIVIDAFKRSKEVHIYMNNFKNAYYIMQQMIQESNESSKKATCHQLVNLQRNIQLNLGDSGIGNVEILKDALPFLVSFKGEYDLRYSYGAVDENYLGTALWPNYVISEYQVLLLSVDGKTGILIENEDIAKNYLEEVKKIQQKYQPLISFVGKDEAALNFLTEEISHKLFKYEYSTSINIAEFIYKTISDEDFINVEIGRQYVSSYKNTQPIAQYKNFKKIGGMSWMKEFMENGILPEIYRNYIKPYSKERRVEMIKEYAKHLEVSQNEYLLKNTVNDQKASFGFNLVDSNGIYICISKNNQYYASIYIEEIGIYDTFADYIEGLIEEEKVYSAKESGKKFLEQCMKYLEEADG